MINDTMDVNKWLRKQLEQTELMMRIHVSSARAALNLGVNEPEVALTG